MKQFLGILLSLCVGQSFAKDCFKEIDEDFSNLNLGAPSNPHFFINKEKSASKTEWKWKNGSAIYTKKGHKRQASGSSFFGEDAQFEAETDQYHIENVDLLGNKTSKTIDYDGACKPLTVVYGPGADGEQSIVANNDICSAISEGPGFKDLMPKNPGNGEFRDVMPKKPGDGSLMDIMPKKDQVLKDTPKDWKQCDSRKLRQICQKHFPDASKKKRSVVDPSFFDQSIIPD